MVHLVGVETSDRDPRDKEKTRRGREQRNVRGGLSVVKSSRRKSISTDVSQGG